MSNGQTIEEKLASVQARIEAYQEVKEQIKILELKRSEGQLTTLIDWGESFYSEAKVTDLDRIFVCIGSGVFMDFTLQEARQVADKWLHLLERKKDIFVGQLAHEVAQHQSA